MLALRTCRFRFGSPIGSVSLATPANSPHSYSKLTLQHRLASLGCLRGRPLYAAADHGC